MATWLRQSTAVDIGFGPFLDNADGNTTETGLTITQPDIRLKKNGGAWAQKNAAQTLSHEENGWYEVSLDTTDTNTLGILIVAVHESGALPVWREFMVVTAQVWDSFFGADTLDVSVTQWLGQAVAAVTVNGVPEVDVTHWRGTAAAAPTVAGVPAVEVIDVSAAGQTDVRAAVGLASANLDTQLATIPTAAAIADAVWDEVILSDHEAPDSAGNFMVIAGDPDIATSTAAAVAGVAVDGSTTLAESLRLSNAALGGKASGLGTTNVKFRDLADTKDRIDATVDTSGNRTAVTRDLT